MTMRSFKEMRQDPHCPSNMDPADYVMVGEFDAGTSYKWVRHNVLRRFGVETGNNDQYSFNGVPFFDAMTDADPPRPNYRCHHCGKHGSNIRYFVLFLHKPSKQVIVVGQICAKKLKLESKDELDRLQTRRDTFERDQRQRQWIDEHPEEVAYLTEYDMQHTAGGMYHEFFESLYNKLKTYGNLTDGQVSGLRKWMAKGKPWERNAPKPEPIDADRHKGVVTMTSEPPTQPQLDYIAKLAAELDLPYDMPETREDASALINALKAAKLEGQEAEREANAPAWTREPMSDRQRARINYLMEERSMAPEARQEARRRLDAGLTKGQASRWIDKLLELPMISEAAS